MKGLIFGLSIVVDVLGLAGAILVLLPFFREFSLKRLLHWLHEPAGIAGLDRAIGASRKVASRELERFQPRDGTYVVSGLLAIAASYLLHIVAEILDYIAT